MSFVTRYFEQIEPQSETAHGGYSPLADYVDRRAVVILGRPSIGKTREFMEAAANDPNAIYCKISQFLRDPLDEFRDKTVYLDALDEHRAEVAGQTVMAAIVGRLKALGGSGLSCLRFLFHLHSLNGH